LSRELVDDSGSAPPVDLVLLTSGAVSVAGADLRAPEHATLAALAPSLSQENPRLRARAIDIDAGVVATQADVVLAAALGPFEGPVAERAGEIWLRRYEQHPLPEGESAFRNGDVVLITGGLGDVGLTLARHLAATRGCRLVLTTRSEIPPREQWS